MCIDFNFCEACFSARKHRSHPFFKFTVPGEWQSGIRVELYSHCVLCQRVVIFSLCTMSKWWIFPWCYLLTTENPPTISFFFILATSAFEIIRIRHSLYISNLRLKLCHAPQAKRVYISRLNPGIESICGFIADFYRCVTSVCWSLRILHSSPHDADVSSIGVTTSFSGSAWSSSRWLE